MASLEVSFDAQTIDAIDKLTSNIQDLLEIVRLQMKATTPGEFDGWLSAAHFCQKYDIARSTLTRRVKSGSVEKYNDGKIIRYRLAA